MYLYCRHFDTLMCVFTFMARTVFSINPPHEVDPANQAFSVQPCRDGGKVAYF